MNLLILIAVLGEMQKRSHSIIRVFTRIINVDDFQNISRNNTLEKGHKIFTTLLYETKALKRGVKITSG